MCAVSEKSPLMNPVELIPAVLVQSEAEFREKVALIQPHLRTIQLDVMDGQFVNNTTWADAEVVATMELPLVLEAHLMVERPEEEVGKWINAGAARVFVHAESPGDVAGALEQLKAAEVEAGLAINPETTVASISDMLPLVDTVLVMGVTPGFSGQAFQPVAIEKVAELKRLRPELRVEVDGGVNMETAPALVAAGADGLIAASALYKAPDFAKAVEEFQKIFQR